MVPVRMGQIAESVLSIWGSVLAGMATRWVALKTKGRDWYERALLPWLAPLTLAALLFTIVVMFSLKGETIVQIPLDVLRIAVPLVIYFVVMFLLSFWMGRRHKVNYSTACTLSFTAASNNLNWPSPWRWPCSASTRGRFRGGDRTLAEVPALIALVNVALYFKKKFFVEA